jgi:hypothetical protein
MAVRQGGWGYSTRGGTDLGRARLGPAQTMNRLHREMAQLCHDMIGLYSEQPTGPTTSQLAEKARLILSKLEPETLRVEKRRESMADLREKVFDRARGIGELCGLRLAPEPGQLVHLEGGIGRRRQKQKLENCVAEHDRCHRSLDKTPLKWLPEVQAWADRNGYPLPDRFRELAALHSKGVDSGPNIVQDYSSDFTHKGGRK